MLASAHQWLSTARVIGRNLRGVRFEPEVAFLRHLLSPSDVCLHIGASDGRHSYVMSALVPDGRIYAFEPSAFSFGILRRVVRLQRLRNVEPIRAALADRAGETTLQTPTKMNRHPGRSFAFIADGGPTATGRADVRSRGLTTETVPAMTVDGFCAARGIRRVDFIRCDAEGAEMRILTGAKATLDAHAPTVLIEIHPEILASNFGTSGEAVRDLFLARGYRMFRLIDGRLTESTSLAPGPWHDYFFVHPSRRLPPGPFRDAQQPRAS